MYHSFESMITQGSTLVKSIERLCAQIELLSVSKNVQVLVSPLYVGNNYKLHANSLIFEARMTNKRKVDGTIRF